MYPHICHVFIDGGYLRAQATSWGLQPLDPGYLAKGLAESGPVQTWAHDVTKHPNAFLGRITYYDALPDDGEEAGLQKYWDAIELQDDLHLGFGALKGLKKRVRQKGSTRCSLWTFLRVRSRVYSISRSSSPGTVTSHRWSKRRAGAA